MALSAVARVSERLWSVAHCRIIAYNFAVLVRQARMTRLEVVLLAEAMALEPYIKGVIEMRKSCSVALEHAA